MLNDIKFLQNPNIHFIILLRNPHHSVISFYKKCNILDKNFSKLIGYKDCYEILTNIKKYAVNKAIVILSEELYSNPKETVQSFCKNIGINFIENSLKWSNLGINFNGLVEWNEIKKKEVTHYWHSDAIKSTKFIKPENYKTDNNGNPTFSEIRNEHIEMCKQAYIDNLHYYNLMLQESR